MMLHMSGSRGGTWGPNALENHKGIYLRWKTGPAPLENNKAFQPAFSVGPLLVHQRNTVK